MAVNVYFIFDFNIRTTFKKGVVRATPSFPTLSLLAVNPRPLYPSHLDLSAPPAPTPLKQQTLNPPPRPRIVGYDSGRQWRRLEAHFVFLPSLLKL